VGLGERFVELSTVLQKLEAAQKESSKTAELRQPVLDPLEKKLDDISKDVLTKADHGTFVFPPWFLAWGCSTSIALHY
jgi:hypothetical protein